MELESRSISRVFGERVQHFRQKASLTQVTLAELAGISQTFLSAIERGRKFPASETIESLARVLKVPFFELFLEPDSVCFPAGFASDEFMSLLQAEVGRVVREWVERHSEPSASK